MLINWYLGLYQLKLIHHIPSALEMLAVQSIGKRFVNLFNTEQCWIEKTPFQRDHFSFTIHDLVHAHEFFHNTHSKAQQIQFYKKLQIHYPKLVTLCSNPKYVSDLDYLISDMNSHHEHLEVYFQGLLQRYQITPYNLDL